MRDFVITADSNCDLPQEYVDANQIGIIPHYYDIDGVTYGDEKNLTLTRPAIRTRRVAAQSRPPCVAQLCALAAKPL